MSDLPDSVIIGFKCFGCGFVKAKFSKPTNDKRMSCPKCDSENNVSAVSVYTPLASGKWQIASLFRQTENGAWADSVKETEYVPNWFTKGDEL